MDQVGLYPSDQLLQQLHIVLMIGPVGHAVHLIHLGPGLFQGLFQQTSPGDGHQGLKAAFVGVVEVVENDPSRPADVGVTDDVEYSDHALAPLSGSLFRRADRAPRAR